MKAVLRSFIDASIVPSVSSLKICTLQVRSSGFGCRHQGRGPAVSSPGHSGTSSRVTACAGGVWTGSLFCSLVGTHLIIFKMSRAGCTLVRQSSPLFPLLCQHLQPHHPEIMQPFILGHKSSNWGLSPPSTQHNGTLQGIWFPTNKVASCKY